MQLRMSVLAILGLWLAGASNAWAVDGAAEWQHIGKNAAGADVSLHLASIDRRSPVRAARLRLATTIKGEPRHIVVRAEYRCAARQYRLNALLSEKDGRVFDRTPFPDGGTWKMWAGKDDQAFIANIVCSG